MLGYRELCHLAYTYKTGKTAQEKGYDEEYDNFFQSHSDDEIMKILQAHNLPLPNGVKAEYGVIGNESNQPYDWLKFFVLHTDQVPPMIVKFHVDTLEMNHFFILEKDFNKETVESIICQELPNEAVPCFFAVTPPKQITHSIFTE